MLLVGLHEGCDHGDDFAIFVAPPAKTDEEGRGTANIFLLLLKRRERLEWPPLEAAENHAASRFVNVAIMSVAASLKNWRACC